MTLYRVPLSGGAHPAVGVPETVTSSSAMQYGASISNDGRMVFSTMAPSVDVWSVPLRGSGGIVAGPPERLTSDAMGKIDVAAARDGSRFAWVAYAATRVEVRIRETTNGRETTIPLSGKTLGVNPRLSRDGSRLTYADLAGDKFVASVYDTGTATTRSVCEDCYVRDFFSDAPGFLVQSGNRLGRQDAGGGPRRPILDVTGHGRLLEAAVSPSERRIAFTLARPDGSAALLFADASQPGAADRWTTIAEDRNYVGAPSWSPDGRILYYASARDSFVCIWAQRVNAAGNPDGEPIAAFHNHTPPHMLLFGFSRTSASPGRLYTLLADFKGDLWSLTLLR
jgi:hypothetical protein